MTPYPFISLDTYIHVSIKNKILNILSTWGDPHFVALNGIEFFDGSGHALHTNGRIHNVKYLDDTSSSSSSSLSSPSVEDPRVASNLIDGVNHTCDDLHAWVAPFFRGSFFFLFLCLHNF